MAAVNRSEVLRKKLLILIILRRRLRNKKLSRKFWVRPFFASRSTKGLFNTLLKELYLFDHEYFFHSFRLTPCIFESLVKIVARYITKSYSIRDVASPSERLAAVSYTHLTLPTIYSV